MCTLYESIRSLCTERGITGGRMCVDLGLSKSLMTDLKAGRKKGITAETARKIADYFDVSVDRVLGNTTKPLINDDEELTNYLEMLKTRPEMRMLFQISQNATREEVEQAVRIIEALRN